jgi:predicted GNAT family acetyltransferase
MFKHETGRFYMENENGQMIAEINYQYVENYIAATHTFVDPVLRGQGIAQKLVDAVVAVARNEGKKIDPVCPYILKLFQRDAVYSDVFLK